MPIEIASEFVRYAPGLSALAASAAIIKGIYEYVKQNKFRRFEKFQEMSKRFDENEPIQKTATFLLEGSPDLATVSKQEKEVFICFLEEVAMMQNSGYIDKNIAAYTFGHYATLALENDYFWYNLNKDEYYYSLFIKFCQDCKRIRATRSSQDNWKLRA